jgi:hypothetical protein
MSCLLPLGVAEMRRERKRRMSAETAAKCMASIGGWRRIRRGDKAQKLPAA